MSPRSSKPSALVGRPEARLHTQPLRRLTRKTTLGFEAIDFIEGMCGMTLLPWQKWWLLHALELRTGGGFRYRTVLTLVGRQNGKTTLLKGLALYFMYLRGVPLVLGVAQSLDIARESWQGACDMADADPDLRAEIESIRKANGEQCLTLTSGSRYRIAAASRQAGRGLSVDLLIMDELREHRSWDAWGALSKTTSARPNGLIVAISNAGDDESVVLNHLRAAALSGQDETIGLFEWSAPEGCELDDREGWAMANPGLGHTIPESSIRSSMSTDPPAVFRTEVLCQHVQAMDGAISTAAFRSCEDPSASLDKLRDRVAMCLDVAPDAQHSTLYAAAVGDDGKARLDVVAAWGSTAQLRAELPELLKTTKPRIVGWFPKGPAAALLADVAAVRGVRMVPIKDTEVTAVCMGFAEQVAALQVRHTGDPLLSGQLVGAAKANRGDGWVIARRGGEGHVDAVYAAAGALHLARTMPRPATGVQFVAV